jgi:hypothetical protein
MRTTIDIPDDIEPILRSEAHAQRVSLSKVVADILVKSIRGAAVETKLIKKSGFLVVQDGPRATHESVRALEDTP